MDKRPELTREQIRLIYDHTSDLVFLIGVMDGGGYRVESVNRAYLERTQLTPEEIVGLPIEKVLHPDQYAYVRARYDEAVASGNAYRYETRTRMRGQTIYLDTTLVPAYAEQRCTHLVGVSRDITENKRERQALAREKQRAENYLDIAEALIVALDRNCRITMLNRKGYRMLGYPLGSLTGRDWCELTIAPEKRAAFRRGFNAFLDSSDAQRNVNYVRTRNGERRLISWANALIRDDDGAVTGILSSGEDITDRKHAEQALITSQRVLAADEVVSAVAHDFNNSLQGILGNIEMALAVGANGKFQDYLQTATKLADDAARRLRTLREPKIAHTDGEAERLALQDIVDDAIAQTRPLWKDEAQRHGRDLRIRSELPAAPLEVTGNRSDLRTVLYNVLKNAVEAIEDAGEILISGGADGGTAVITVRDTGIGMDRETSTRVFQPFFSTKGLEAGRGLGMSAAHGIVAAHGGTIAVQHTRPGAGTIIRLELPLAEAPEAAAPQPAAGVETGSHRVLWVDDDPDIRALAANYIRTLGHSGDVVDSGAAALAHLERNPYSVVITDVGMPGMSGLELARQIATRGAAAPPVVAITGWGDSINTEDAPPEGVHSVLAKPVRLQKVREILDALPAVPPIQNTN
jgi:PAS domain S-box-containing protein